jgi:hypothetical protein
MDLITELHVHRWIDKIILGNYGENQNQIIFRVKVSGIFQKQSG